MNRRWISARLAGCLLLATLVSPALAQSPAPQANGPSGAPAAPQQQPQHLWDFQKEIGLNDQQVSTMKQDFSGMVTKIRADQEKSRAILQQVNQMVKDNGDLATIKAKLQEAASLQVDMQMTDIQTARVINKVMTAGQLTKWHEIQARMRQQQSSPAPTP